jgi:ATP/maltotriose-dependent transcriptional regulator MalT
VLAVAEIRRGRPLAGLPSLIEAAGNVAPVDPRKALELLVFMMWAASDAGDLAGQVEAARLASTVAPPDDDEWCSFVVAYIEGCGAMAAGDSARGVPLLEEAIEWASSADDERAVYWASAGGLWLGDDGRAGSLAIRSASLARKNGSIGVLAAALGVRASQLFLAQQFDEALVAASEGVQLAREIGADNLVPLPLGVLAGVAAIRGQEEARRQAGEVLEVARAHGLPLRTAAAMRALALADLGRGRWAEALEQLDAAVEAQPSDAVALVAMMVVPDRIEAAVRAGRPERAREALSAFEAWAAHTRAAWVRPRLASCRALLAEGEEASQHYEEALRHASDARPFDLARIHLLYGEHLRRERRRTDSREQLRAALEAFERLQASPWAERARTELRASGETARRRDPSTVDELTPQELQIVRLVSEGLSNKEVAAQLFLSPRTIDYHLRNVFAKLGIKSRTQLAHLSLGGHGRVEAGAEASAV